MPRPPSQGPTPRFTFRLDPVLRTKLEHLAAKDHRTLGDYIELTLQRHTEAPAQRAILNEYPETDEVARMVAEHPTKKKAG